jgi:hypothetical protein
MAELGEIKVKITGDTKEFDKALDDSQKKTKQFSAELSKFGSDMSKFVTLPVLALGAAFVKSAADSEASTKKLQNALKQTGQEVDRNTKSIKDLASALQSQTKFEDDAIVSASALLTQLGQLDAQGVQKVLPGILDFAEALGVDLDTAASLVGKTLGSNTNALARYGIEVDGTASQSAKLAQITQQLEKRFAGSAQAAGQTFAGRLEQLKNTTGDLAEEFGGLLLPILTDLINGVRPIVEGFANLSDGTKQLILQIGGIAAAIGPAIKAFQLLQANPVIAGATVAIAGIIALSEAFNALGDELNFSSEEAGDLVGQIQNLQASAGEVIGPITDLTKNQKLNQNQIDELIKLYPQLDKALIANKTTTIEAAEAVRLATIAKNKEIQTQIQSQINAITAALPLLATQTEAQIKAIATSADVFGDFDDKIRNTAKELIGLRDQYKAISTANGELAVTTQMRLDIENARAAELRRQAEIEQQRLAASLAADKAKEDSAKAAIAAEKEYADAIIANADVTNEYLRSIGVRTTAEQLAYDKKIQAEADALQASIDAADQQIALSQARLAAEAVVNDERLEDAKSTDKAIVESDKNSKAQMAAAFKEAEANAKAYWDKQIDDAKKSTEFILSSFVQLFSALKALSDAYLQAELDNLDARMMAEIEAAGVAEDTKLESLQKQLDKAIEKGDAEEVAELNKEIERTKIQERYARERAQIEYEFAKEAHGLQVAQAIASGLLAAINSFASASLFGGPIAGAIAAGLAAVFTGLQVAALEKAAPKPPAFADGGIVMPQNGGIVGQIAEAGQPEVIFPLDKLNSFLSSTGGGGSGSGDDGMMHVTVQLDSKPILDKIFPATRNGRVLIDARAVV